jgi:hypothetical protein
MRPSSTQARFFTFIFSDQEDIVVDKKLDLQKDQKVARKEQHTIGQKPPRPDGALEDTALDAVSGGGQGGASGGGRGIH